MILRTDNHLFFAKGKNVYVVFRGLIIQIVPAVFTHCCVFKNELITVNNDNCLDLRVWQIDPTSGRLLTFQRYPHPYYDVAFAGLWKHYIIVCSLCGQEKYYDIQERAVCSFIPPDKATGTVIYQLYRTVWPDSLRKQDWIWLDRHQHLAKSHDHWSHDHWIMSWEKTFFSLKAEHISVHNNVIWGLLDGKIRSWSCYHSGPPRRCPQLWLLVPHFPSHLTKRIFKHVFGGKVFG